MKSLGHIRALGALALLLVCAVFALAQWDKKPYTEWSEKETQKMLYDSPWSKTQTFIASTETFGTTRPDGGQGRFVKMTSDLHRLEVQLFALVFDERAAQGQRFRRSI